jgi:hypothetical protein
LHEISGKSRHTDRERERERERENAENPCLTHNIIIPHKVTTSNDKEKYGKTKGKKNELTA